MKITNFIIFLFILSYIAIVGLFTYNFINIINKPIPIIVHILYIFLIILIVLLFYNLLLKELKNNSKNNN